MEHAIRHHIKKKLDEDPVYYQKLSERLEEILKKFGENWEQLALALGRLHRGGRAKGRQKDDDTGPRPGAVRPVLRPAQRRAREGSASARRRRQVARRADRADGRAASSATAVSVVGFWKNATRQEELRARIFMFLDENEIVDFDRCDTVADRLMELAKANHEKLVEGVMTLTVDDLHFEVRRSPRRKSVQVTVDRAGELVLSAPEIVPDREDGSVRPGEALLDLHQARREGAASVGPASAEGVRDRRGVPVSRAELPLAARRFARTSR